MEETKKIILSEIPLRQKIAQMIIVRGNIFDLRFTELGIGGIFLPKLNSKEEYKKIVLEYQKNARIKLLVAADMEGYLNPFSKFYKSIPFRDVIDENEAYRLGKEQGKIMKEIGFNLNFSPVVEMKNIVWPGRSFNGSLEDVKSKIRNYIKGLQEEGIMATAKHYPGGSMVKDPHKIKYRTQIHKEDLELFDESMQAGVKAIMVGHPIVYGAIDSNGKQCTISSEVISTLRKKFNGLIITDTIMMEGLKSSYPVFSKVYPYLVKAGNDIILDSDSRSTYDRVIGGIIEIEKSVRDGVISEKEIDEHVKRILGSKGYVVSN